MSDYKFELGDYVSSGTVSGKVIGRMVTTAGDRYYTFEESNKWLWHLSEDTLKLISKRAPTLHNVGDEVIFIGDSEALRGTIGVIDDVLKRNGLNLVTYKFNKGHTVNRVTIPEHHVTKYPIFSRGKSSEVDQKLEELTVEVKQLKEKVESLLPKEKPKTIFVNAEDVKVGDLIYNRGETAIVDGVEHSRSGKTNTPRVKITLNKKNYKMGDAMWFRYGVKISKVMDS